jgi:hypothetical protein
MGRTVRASAGALAGSGAAARGDVDPAWAPAEDRAPLAVAVPPANEDEAGERSQEGDPAGDKERQLVRWRKRALTTSPSTYLMLGCEIVGLGSKMRPFAWARFTDNRGRHREVSTT